MKKLNENIQKTGVSNLELWEGIITSNNNLNSEDAEKLANYFQKAYFKIYSETITMAEFENMYTNFMTAKYQGYLSDNFQRAYLVALFDSKVDFNLAEQEELITLKESLFSVAEEIDTKQTR